MIMSYDLVMFARHAFQMSVNSMFCFYTKSYEIGTGLNYWLSPKVAQKVPKVMTLVKQTFRISKYWENIFKDKQNTGKTNIFPSLCNLEERYYSIIKNLG